MLPKILLVLLPCLPYMVVAGMYGQPVVNLDAKTFKQALAVEHAAMIAFVAPWCGHCKALGPEYTAAAQSLSPLIPFYAIDCDEAANKPLCGEYQIKGFPTIKAFPRALKGAARDYNGERKRGALVEYAKGLVPDRVKKLRAEEPVEGVLQKFLDEKPSMPHALLIHPSAPSIPFLWKVLGHRFASRMHMGYLRDTPSHSVLSALGVYDSADTSKDTARAVVWNAGASRTEVVEYDGALKFNALLEFLQSSLDGTAPPPGEKQRPAHAPNSAASSTATNIGTGESAAEKRARLQAKLDEEEKRDRARREKAAQNAASPVEPADDRSGEGSSDTVVGGAPEENVVASPVEAARPAPEEGVEEEMLEGQTPAEGVVPEAAPPQEGEGIEGVEEPERTIVHEEL